MFARSAPRSMQIDEPLPGHPLLPAQPRPPGADAVQPRPDATLLADASGMLTHRDAVASEVAPPPPGWATVSTPPGQEALLAKDGETAAWPDLAIVLGFVAVLLAWSAHLRAHERSRPASPRRAATVLRGARSPTH